MGLGKVLESGFNLLKVRTMAIWLKIGNFIFYLRLEVAIGPRGQLVLSTLGCFFGCF